MTNSTISADIPRKTAAGSSGGFFASGAAGGGWPAVNLLPGGRPLHGNTVTKGKSLYKEPYLQNTLSPANIRYTCTNNQQGADSQYAFVVNDGFDLAMLGTNQYSDKGAGNHSAWDYNGATVHSPWQWVSINGSVLMEIASGTQKRTAFPSTWGYYDLVDHMVDDGKNGFKIVAVYMGYTNTVLLKNGIVMCSGYNGHGQIGDSGTTNMASWRIAGAGFSYPGASSNWYDRMYYDPRTNKKRKIIQIANACEQSDSAHALYALGDDGTLWGWGYNGYGQVAVNNSTTSNSVTYSPRCCVRGPKTGESGVQRVEDAVYVRATNGSYGTVWYIDEDGRIWAAGRNSYYQMQYAYGNNQTYFQPVGHSGAGTWGESKKCIKIEASGNGDVCHSAYLFDDGTVSTGGYSGYGQVLNGSTAGTNNRITLDTHFGPSGSKGKAIDVWCTGGQYGQTYILTDQYKLWCGGYSGYGQLGNGRSGGTYNGLYETNTDWASQVAGVTEPWHNFNSNRYPIKICSGGWGSTNSVIMLLSDGTVWHTGRNNQWQRYRQGANYYYWTTPQLPYANHGKCVDVWVGDSGSDASTHYFLMEDGALYCTGYYHSWDNNSWYVHDNPIMINGQFAGIA